MLEVDKEISKANLRKFGWNLDFFNEGTPFNSHYFYFKDYRTGHVQIFTVTQENFESITPPSTIAIGDCIGNIAAILHKMATQQSLSDLEKQSLVPTLVCYVKLTSTYRQAKAKMGLEDRLHFMVNVYPEKRLKNVNACVFRPFVVIPHEVMVSATEFQEYAESVHKADKQNRPEWFSKSKR